MLLCYAVTIMMILTSYQSLLGPVISQPGRDTFELNTEGRMEGDDRGGHPQISLSHFDYLLNYYAGFRKGFCLFLQIIVINQ